MQGLDAAIKHFRKTGILRDFLDLEIGERKSAAVPPVEMISTPSFCRPLAKSTKPVLSETEINARLTLIITKQGIKEGRFAY
jgi:hypothetical protein